MVKIAIIVLFRSASVREARTRSARKARKYQEYRNNAEVKLHSDETANGASFKLRRGYVIVIQMRSNVR